MHASCTWTRATRQHVPAGTRHRRGGRCPYRGVPVHGLDDVLQRTVEVETMTAAELRRALLLLGRPARTLLGRPAPTRRMDVLKARLRIAVRLEQLGG